MKKTDFGWLKGVRGMKNKRVVGRQGDCKNDKAARWLAKNDTPARKRVLRAIEKGTWKDWDKPEIDSSEEAKRLRAIMEQLGEDPMTPMSPMPYDADKLPWED